MDNNEFEILQKKLDAINASIAKNHQENFNWANALYQNQMQLRQTLDADKAPKNFEPYYLHSMPISTDYPEIFNKYGERMEVFFISDREFAHVPNDSLSKYVIWDRYNYGLDVHFYTHDEIFRTVGKPKRKFGALIEPRSIKPQS